jgi:uncharacterized Zn finger protein (UPF0148 family)
VTPQLEMVPDNITEEDGVYKVLCPFCGEEFEADDLDQARNKEGIHRSLKHIKDGSEDEDYTIKQPDESTSFSMIEQWNE